jgi:hypothetical protein
MGAVEEKLIADLSRAGQPLPEKIQNAPTLLLGLEFYYNAFQDLSSCRSVGMGLGPIPWTAMNDYCRSYGIRGEQREDFFHHVSALDDKYREYVNKEAEKNKNKGKR